MEKERYERYVQLLRDELQLALGCTEPITVAYAAALAREALDALPERVIARCNGNIIKNAKSVTVPNSGGQKGLEAAATLGVLGGKAEKQLEVLTDVTAEQIARSRELVAQGYCRVELAEGLASLYVEIIAQAGDDTASVIIEDRHTNVVRIERNGLVLQEQSAEQQSDECAAFLTIDGILEFARFLHTEDVRELFERQITFNTKIAQEGIDHHYGVGIGKKLLGIYGNSVQVRASALAAAGSDARMSGCDLAVVINAGSGNQGITVTLPVVEYAKELNVSREMLYRALAISNLVSIHIKHGIGSLSAFCGAVSASAGSAAAITFLQGGSGEQIGNAISNTLGILSGLVCDGAKPSCAGKVSQGIECAILASNMALRNDNFQNGDGIIGGSIEDTVANVSRLAKEGMKETDIEILNIMIGR